MLYLLVIEENGKCRKHQLESDEVSIEQIEELVGGNVSSVFAGGKNDFYECFYNTEADGKRNVSAMAMTDMETEMRGTVVVAKVFGDEIVPLSDEIEDDEYLYFIAQIGGEMPKAEE